MAGDSRRSTRTGAGPGRGSPRSRTAARTATRSSASPTGSRRGEAAGPQSIEARPSPGGQSGPRALPITRRAVALFVVLIILGVSYASSLRVYMNQERDLAVTRTEIAERTATIGSLSDQLARWKDPSYVRIQARERLAWVIPGETGYVVLDESGNPIDARVDIGNRRSDEEQPDADAWWARMWGSVQAADHPAVKPADETAKPEATKSPR